MMLRCSAVSRNIRAGELRAALTSDLAARSRGAKRVWEASTGPVNTENVQKRVTTTPDHGGRDSVTHALAHTSRLLCARSLRTPAHTSRQSSHTGGALETDSYLHPTLIAMALAPHYHTLCHHLL